jgi:phytoene/squalene synthetase
MADSHAPEDFPSLLPKRLIAPDTHAGLDAMSAFMASTRAIADDPKTAPHLKDAQLTALEGAMTTQEGYVPLPRGVSPTIMSAGFTLRRESDERRIPVIYGRRVVQAYKQDVAKPNKVYRDWSELLQYFRYAAGASAIYTLEVLGLDRSLAPAIEALATANALLARMESMGADFSRKRMYLPQRWLQDAGLDVEELSLDHTADETAKWLKVRDEGVAQVRKLLTQGTPAIKAARFAGAAAPAPASGPATTRGSSADGYLAGPGNIEGRAHSGADLSGAGPESRGGMERWKLKLALAWVKAGLEARCNALAASPAFPAAPVTPSRTRLALATLRSLI